MVIEPCGLSWRCTCRAELALHHIKNNNVMETVYFQGTPCRTCSDCPKVGTVAPGFTLTGKDLGQVRLEDYRGRKVVLNIFPSLDTPVCAASVRRFNAEAAAMDNTAVICISMDLPFAMGRFCSAEGIEGVTVASAFRDPQFGLDYGLTITEGPLHGLLARCVFVIDESGRITYRDLVHEITDEPDYHAALVAIGREK